MTGICELCENDKDDSHTEYENPFDEELKEFPQVLDFIRSLQATIKRQRKKFENLTKKLLNVNKQLSKTKIELVDREIQTIENEFSQDWDRNGSSEGGISIVDQVKEAAESALRQTGFVYEETSGLYYDYNSGYYYDAARGLYYDGNSGTFYVYDQESKSYKFHSQTEVTPNEADTQQEKVEKMDKRKGHSANKDEAKKRKLSHRKESLNGDEPEEGECSDSDNSQSSRDIPPEPSFSNETENPHEEDIAKTYPPCMRIIVKDTTLPKLKIGTLFLVAYTGGSIGREGDHSVLIPDLNVSKHHARFQYDEEKKHYTIVDSGSRNGTCLNGKRLSVAKQESDPCVVAHGSIVQIATTKLICHIHDGRETCGHCEPGLVQQNNTLENTATPTIKDRHKSELRRLKNKFGVEKGNTESASQVATGYQDRAQARREYVGSSNHHVKTQQSCVETSIAKDNKGFKLLSKMGWSEGQSLGKDGDGRTEPVPLVNKQSKAGFGAPDGELSLQVDPNLEKKHKLWRKTQKRYNEIAE